MSQTIPDEFHFILRKGKHSPHPCQSPRLSGITHPLLHDRHFSTPPKYHRAALLKSDVFTVSAAAAVEPYVSGTPRFGPPETQELKVADHIDSIARFWALLCDFPRLFLNPLGGTQDLYGRDASIMQVTSPGEMMDAVRDQWEIPRPSEEQKAQFDEVVSIIDKWCMHGCA